MVDVADPANWIAPFWLAEGKDNAAEDFPWGCKINSASELF